MFPALRCTHPERADVLIKLFIFDMGGVLLRNFEVIPEICSILGVPQSDFINLFRDRLFDLEEGKLTANEFWENYSAEAGISIDRELFKKLFNPSVDLSTERLIRQLKINFRIVCGTNTIKEHWEYLTHGGYYNIFDKVYASYIMKIAKPRKEFYKVILKSENVLPNEVVFVDDFKENVDAALGLGLNGFLFKDASTFIRELRKSFPDIFTYSPLQEGEFEEGVPSCTGLV